MVHTSNSLLADLLPTGLPVAWLPAPRGKLCAVPVDSWRRATSGVAIYPAHRASARLVRALLRAWVAVRAMTTASRGSVPRDWPLGVVLQSTLPGAESASGMFAPRDRARRATLLVMDRLGRPLAFVKYSGAPLGIQLLRNEVNVLARTPDGLGPRILLHASFLSGEILVESVIGGRPCAPRLELGVPQQRFLQALARCGDPRPLPAPDHPLVRRHREADGLHRPYLERAVNALDGRGWRQVLMHGDFSFANTREMNGACVAFDWEWGTDAGFPHLDAAHWITRVACNIQHLTPPAAAKRVVPVLANAIEGPDREYARGIAALAAIHSAVSWYGPDLAHSREAAWLLRFADACLDRRPA